MSRMSGQVVFLTGGGGAFLYKKNTRNLIAPRKRQKMASSGITKEVTIISVIWEGVWEVYWSLSRQKRHVKYIQVPRAIQTKSNDSLIAPIIITNKAQTIA